MPRLRRDHFVGMDATRSADSSGESPAVRATRATRAALRAVRPASTFSVRPGRGLRSAAVRRRTTKGLRAFGLPPARRTAGFGTARAAGMSAATAIMIRTNSVQAAGRIELGSLLMRLPPWALGPPQRLSYCRESDPRDT